LADEHELLIAIRRSNRTFHNYRVVDGRTIPHAAEVAWIVDGEEFLVGAVRCWGGTGSTR
jgi:hypothetical protein